MQAFYEKLAEILEVDEVKTKDRLREFENWDSLTILSVIAMLDASFGINMTAKNLQKIETVGELATFIDRHREDKNG
jgi:acyl carrier protein